jgi:hypothetical protein
MPAPRNMYVEQKSDGNRWLDDRGPAEIGEVTFSQTGKTIYFKGKSFERIKGGGVAGNYRCVETGDEYWITGVKKRGTNRHWAGGGLIKGE